MTFVLCWTLLGGFISYQNQESSKKVSKVYRSFIIYFFSDFYECVCLLFPLFHWEKEHKKNFFSLKLLGTLCGQNEFKIRLNIEIVFLFGILWWAHNFMDIVYGFFSSGKFDNKFTVWLYNQENVLRSSLCLTTEKHFKLWFSEDIWGQRTRSFWFFMKIRSKFSPSDRYCVFECSLNLFAISCNQFRVFENPL